jgi:hypothetical protein
MGDDIHSAAQGDNDGQDDHSQSMMNKMEGKVIQSMSPAALSVNALHSRGNDQQGDSNLVAVGQPIDTPLMGKLPNLPPSRFMEFEPDTKPHQSHWVDIDYSFPPTLPPTQSSKERAKGGDQPGEKDIILPKEESEVTRSSLLEKVPVPTPSAPSFESDENNKDDATIPLPSSRLSPVRRVDVVDHGSLLTSASEEVTTPEEATTPAVCAVVAHKLTEEMVALQENKMDDISPMENRLSVDTELAIEEEEEMRRREITPCTRIAEEVIATAIGELEQQLSVVEEFAAAVGATEESDVEQEDLTERFKRLRGQDCLPVEEGSEGKEDMSQSLELPPPLEPESTYVDDHSAASSS